MGTGATSPAPALGCAGAPTALGGPLCASVVTAGKRAAQVSQRDGDSRAPKWTAKPARARPNGAPPPGPQDGRGRRGRPGGVIEEREPRRDRRPPVADAVHLASLSFSSKSLTPCHPCHPARSLRPRSLRPMARPTRHRRPRRRRPTLLGHRLGLLGLCVDVRGFCLGRGRRRPTRRPGRPCPPAGLVDV